MKRYRVIVTPSAANDISRAYEWLKAERPRYEEAWLDEIRERIRARDPAGISCRGAGERGVR